MTARDLHTLLAHAAGDARPDAELVALAPNPAALTVLVRRHGPLVWATCRRMLPDPADAADAFQAVFLALARSANRIRTPAAVGGWLHAAAVRVCLKQRRTAARRRLREKRVARPEADAPVADAAWDAILAAVHEEIHHLPDGERTAFVLCELQGVPAGEAASRLGWKAGTLTGRLSKARARLLTRLSARGFAPAVGLAGVGTLAVPAEVLALAGPAASVSPAVVALSTEITAMVTTKHLAAAVLVTAGLLAGVGGGLVTGLGAQEPAKPARAAAGGGPDGGAAPPKAEPKYFPPDAELERPSDGAPVRSRWEYRYDPKPEAQVSLMGLLNSRGQEGWEFAGVVTLSDPAPAPAGGMSGPGGMMPGLPGGESGMPGRGGMGAGRPATTSVVVFKRAAGGRPVPVAGANLPTLSSPPGSLAQPASPTATDTLTHQFKYIQAHQMAGAVNLMRGVKSVFVDGQANRLVVTVETPFSGQREIDAISNLIKLADRPTGINANPLSAPPAASPKTVGGFQVIALKHAKAADVARTVRELLSDKNNEGFAVSSDEQRNLVLYRLPWNSIPGGLEKAVQKLVAELDVPAK